MVRHFIRSCALVVLIASSAIAHTSNTSRSPVEWINGYTLVLVDGGSTDEITRARDHIISQGGRVAIVLPPHAMFGWIPAEADSQLIGRHGIRSIHRTPVAGQVAFNDRTTKIAIKLFNDVASGRRAREIMSAAKAPAGADNDRPPMIGCAEPRPQINGADLIRNLQSLGAEESLRRLQSDFRPQFFGNSDVMDGTIAVAVFLVESNGGTDPNVYNWSQADQTTAIAEVIDGLNWWVDQSRAFGLARPLQFTVIPYLADNPACRQPYEPVLRPGNEAHVWVDEIMNNLGVGAGQSFVRVAAFNEWLRDQNRAHWGFSLFISYNPAPANTFFTDGRASWAYLGGPYVNMLFRSYGWKLSQLISHEAGHIFYACDEYSQPGHATCSCTCVPEVRPQATNGNCQDASCGVQSTQCMMRLNELALCPYTVAQIGWTGAVPRPLPSAPAGLVVTASSPTQVNLVWQDTSSVEEGFQVERRGGSSADYTQVAVVAAGSTSHTDSTALPNTAYTYRVRAFNSSGVSSYSSEANVITPVSAPTLSVGTTSLPDATVSVPYSRSLVASGGAPDYTWTIESGALPPGLSLSSAGTVAGTPPSAGTYNFVTRVTDSTNASATKALTIIVKPTAPLAITTTTLPRGSVGATYSQNVGVSGGQTPYTWSVQSGNLPEGLSLNQANGIISGTPDRAGTSSFVITVTDAVSVTVTSTLSIVINPGLSALSLETASLPDGQVGQDYSHALAAIGGTAPYRWQIKSGKLPDGLQLSEAGLISGRPTSIGEIEFEVQVSDQSGQLATREFSIDVDPAPELTIISPTALPVAAVGVPYRFELKATAGQDPYKWVKKKKKKFGTLPEGITVSSDGVLAGTATTQGAYIFTLRVVDQSGKIASKSFTLEVGPPPPPLSIKTETLPQGRLGINYRAQLEALGGAGGYSWVIESGALPAGLAMSAEGAITGQPNAIGTTAFIVRVRDAVGTATTKQLLLVIAQPPPPLVIQTVQLAETTAERAYQQSLQATGGVPPYTWSIASGSLASGLSLSADGTISGTPLVAGTSVFVVRVTDSAEQTATRTLAIQVKPADKLAPFGLLETPGHRATLTLNATGTGWALDNVGVAAIEILIDNQKVGEAVHGQPRPDVATVWGGFPNAAQSGFSFTFDTTKLTNGDHTLAVRVVDAAGNATIIGSRTITVQNRVLTIVTNEMPRGKKGEPYNVQLQVANGRAPFTWGLTSGSLPPGLSLNISGLVSGTPSAFGVFQFGVRVTDSSGAAAAANLSVTILNDIDPLRVLSTGDLLGGQTGANYSQQLFFAGGKPPVQWSLASGSLPAGLTLSATGLISGKPTQAGTFIFTAQVTDSEQQTATSTQLRIIVTIGPLTITSSGNLTEGKVNTSYSHQLTFTGGRSPFIWSLAPGNALPEGLTLNQATGAISGTPTQAGTFTFTVTLRDGTPQTVSSSQLRIVISP